MLIHKKYLEKNLEVSKIIIIFAPQKTTSNNLKKNNYETLQCNRSKC